MELIVRRKYTLQATTGSLYVDGRFVCYTLEDVAHPKIKIPGETCIGEGRYRLSLRTYGSHHWKYSQKFWFHVGMLQIQDVPKFKDVLIHIGNTIGDTKGCLLVGSSLDGNILKESTKAYERLYLEVADALTSLREVYITFEEVIDG